MKNNKNITIDLSLKKIIENNLILQIFFLFIIIFLIFDIFLIMSFLFKKYSTYLKNISPFTRIKRKRGISIELGNLNHKIVEKKNDL